VAGPASTTTVSRPPPIVPTSWLMGRPTGVVDEVRVADPVEGREEERGFEREVRDGIRQS
jgi:hypothetical protein